MEDEEIIRRFLRHDIGSLILIELFSSIVHAEELLKRLSKLYKLHRFIASESHPSSTAPQSSDSSAAK
jgi:hypothetical protein